LKDYVLDANAILRYFLKGPGIEVLDRIFARAERGEAMVAMSVINRGEALYTLAKHAGMLAAIETFRALSHYVESVDVNEQFATEAATLKFTYKAGYADCFAAVLAIRRGATLVTADPDFTKFGKLLKILALPRHKA
jgi:predicted nucleic acid-binding protein